MSATQHGLLLIAHESTHVIYQTDRPHAPDLPAIQRDHHNEGEADTHPEEQHHCFLEVLLENPAYTLASIGEILEIGVGRFEVYGLIYYDTPHPQIAV